MRNKGVEECAAVIYSAENTQRGEKNKMKGIYRGRKERREGNEGRKQGSYT